MTLIPRDPLAAAAASPQDPLAAVAVIRVLVVDDSAFVRKIVTHMLSASTFIEVTGTARDGREALELAEQMQPDVIICDLNMPEMNGVTFVHRQMARRRVPIIIISVASSAGDQVLAALDAGAVDFVQKPTALANERLMEMAGELIEKVKAAARASVRRVIPAAAEVAPVALSRPWSERGTVELVVIGISTGGPQGLKLVIPKLPADLPVPIAIVLHMPVGYTEMYAKKLDELSPLWVKEAEDGDPLNPGVVLIAPAGQHLTFGREKGVIVAHLDVHPRDTPHRPSVDVLFASAADVVGPGVLGVVMTGMGADGRDGAARIKARGGRILTEAEESCVVYGMPRSVDEAGLSDRRVPIEEMADAIMEQL
jgi:two-component system chemotaxis response regulator CheB